MEMFNRINAFLGIFFVAMLMEAAFTFFNTGEVDLIGFGYKILIEEGEVEGGEKLKITPEMEKLIEAAYYHYSNNDLRGATLAFNQLMEKRVQAGGVFDINSFTDYIQEEKHFKFKSGDKYELGYVVDVKEGRKIHDRSEEIGKFIENLDDFSTTLLYILAPGKLSSAVVQPNRKKIKYDGRTYYNTRDKKGDLGVYRSIFLWWDLPADEETTKGFLISSTNGKRKNNILLSKDHLYNFNKNTRQSFLGKSFEKLNELSNI